MPSAPSSNAFWYASWKSPGLHAAVVGNGVPGVFIRVQNSSVERFTPAENASDPKLTISGTVQGSEGWRATREPYRRRHRLRVRLRSRAGRGKPVAGLW